MKKFFFDKKTLLCHVKTNIWINWKKKKDSFKTLNRSLYRCCQRYSIKNVLKNFIKFTGQYLCWSLYFDKVTGLRPETLLKKTLQYRCFLGSFVKLRKPALQNTSQRLLLFVIHLLTVSFCKQMKHSVLLFFISQIHFILYIVNVFCISGHKQKKSNFVNETIKLY